MKRYQWGDLVIEAAKEMCNYDDNLNSNIKMNKIHKCDLRETLKIIRLFCCLGREGKRSLHPMSFQKLCFKPRMDATK